MNEELAARTGRSMQWVGFRVGSIELAIDILSVSTIEKLERAVTRVPGTPPFINGVFNLRGEIVPLVDMRKRFGFAPAEPTEESRVVIVHLNDCPVGVLVDGVPEVLHLLETSIEPVDFPVGGIDPGFIRGVVRVDDAFVLLLNLERVLSPDQDGEVDQTEVG